jgi:hypothetical protein
MATLMVKKGASRQLPGGSAGKFSGGIGWDAADGTNPDEKIDLDWWTLRYWKSGKVEAIYWGNEDWFRRDLGFNVDPDTGDESPWVATPELDVLYKGDDRSGKNAKVGYDENTDLDLSKRPVIKDPQDSSVIKDEVIKYECFVTYYEDPDEGTGNTLGMAQNIVCGMKDEKSGHEVKIELESNHGFNVTVLVATITADGKMENNDEGFDDKSMFDVAKERGVVFTG